MTAPCYSGPAGTSGVGECKNGVRSCTGGKWGPCTGSVGPSAEACDGKDNDCDGVTDNGATCPAGQSCTAGSCG